MSNLSATHLHSASRSRANSYEAFQAAVEKWPWAIAVQCPNRVLSYSELHRDSLALGAELRSIGVGAGDLVAISMDPSSDLLIAILGTLAAGAAYLPLDTRNPPNRRALILDDAKPAALIEPSAEASGRRLQISRLRQGDDARSGVWESDGQLAYVIYTSGTTGRPKGVQVTHGNLMALFDACALLLQFTADDTWVLFHSYAFDFSVWEIWGALLYGGRLVIPDRWVQLDPEAFSEFIIAERVSVLNQTPTAFSPLSRAILRRKLTQLPLRYVIFGGERLQPAILGPWIERYGLEAPQLVNMYGITETTVHATFHRVTSADLSQGLSLIGRPLPGFRTKVVDENSLDADEGELLLAGPQVSRGYIGHPELTSQRFIQRSDEAGVTYYRSGDIVKVLPAGDFAFLGRKDQQVKIRGHRIELGEVENAILSFDELSEAVVLEVSTEFGASALLCAYTTRFDGEIEQSRLRRETQKRLPQYMWPTYFLCLRDIPRTVNGKIDRAAVAKCWEKQNDKSTTRE